MQYYWNVFVAWLQANLHGLWGLAHLEPHCIETWYDKDGYVLVVCCHNCRKVFYQPPDSPERKAANGQ